MLDEALRRKVSVDWTVYEDVRAHLSVIVKRTLRKYSDPRGGNVTFKPAVIVKRGVSTMLNQNQVRANDALGHLEVRTVPSECIYPFRAVWGDLLGQRQHHDVVIHAIALLNRSSRVISTESITVEGTHQGRLLQRVLFDREELQQRARPIVARDQLGLRRLVELILWTDQVMSPQENLSSTGDLEPGCVLVLPSVYLMFHKQPDTLRLVVTVNVDGARHEVESTLSVVQYASRVTYSFPLEGTWFMKGTPNAGVFDHHRFGVTNEFGVDFLRLGSSGELFKDDGKRASDYYSYGERVLAAARGEVVAVNNAEVQEWSRFNPKEGETEEQFRERQLNDVGLALQGDVGRWAAGNYIVIQHAEHEYSAYLHLKEESVRVKVGDVVQRGQHIADVGNTGDSFGAHLHFQVLDSPDLMRGRSLPFAFENIDVSLSEPGWFVQTVS